MNNEELKKPKKGKNNYNKYKQITIELEDFNKLDSDAQAELIKDTLNQMWDGKVEVEKGYIMKCIRLSISKINDELHLPKGLMVEKNASAMVFSFKQHRNTMLLIVMFSALLLVGLFSATYSAIIMIKQNEINVDIDGDGIPDLNIDTDNDGEAEININTNLDNKPDLNVDYKGNRMSVFNIDLDNDGKSDSNLINDATGDKTCTLNCDSTGDGWPDYNIDLDGDGKADVDIDTNGDKVLDLNIDMNGDGLADLNIDSDNDNKCDKNCTDTGLTGEDIKHSGSSTVSGNPESSISSNDLVVFYQDYGELLVSGLFPDDQENVNVVLPTKKFTITNESNYTVIYKLTWEVYKNTFTSNNFKYKLEGTNGAYSQDYVTAPWGETVISENVKIAPLTTQSYTITFDLFGIGEPQNYDQNKIFSGYIKVGD